MIKYKINLPPKILNFFKDMNAREREQYSIQYNSKTYTGSHYIFSFGEISEDRVAYMIENNLLYESDLEQLPDSNLKEKWEEKVKELSIKLKNDMLIREEFIYKVQINLKDSLYILVNPLGNPFGIYFIDAKQTYALQTDIETYLNSRFTGHNELTYELTSLKTEIVTKYYEYINVVNEPSPREDNIGKTSCGQITTWLPILDFLRLSAKNPYKNYIALDSTYRIKE